jgi:hypothetical protein
MEHAMTGKELERLLEQMQPHGATHLDHLGRSLRGAGLMPLGGRGTSAPQMDVQSVVNMLIALGVAEKPTEGPKAVITYAPMEASSSGDTAHDHARPFLTAGTFGEAMQSILSSVATASAVTEVLIFQNWPRAIIRCSNSDHDGFYGFAGHSAAAAAGHRATPSGPIFRYSGSTLAQIALELESDSETTGGWAGDRA